MSHLDCRLDPREVVPYIEAQVLRCLLRLSEVAVAAFVS
jgi:hypothetical protein